VVWSPLHGPCIDVKQFASSSWPVLAVTPSHWKSPRFKRYREINTIFEAIKNPRRQISSESNSSLINLVSKVKKPWKHRLRHLLGPGLGVSCSNLKSSAAPSPIQLPSTDCDLTQEIWRIQYKASRTRVTALQPASLHTATFWHLNFWPLVVRANSEFRIRNIPTKISRRATWCSTIHAALTDGHRIAIDCAVYSQQLALHFIFSGFRSVFLFSTLNYFLVSHSAENSNSRFDDYVTSGMKISPPRSGLAYAFATLLFRIARSIFRTRFAIDCTVYSQLALLLRLPFGFFSSPL
jgi:hypothetical protein